MFDEDQKLFDLLITLKSSNKNTSKDIACVFEKYYIFFSEPDTHFQALSTKESSMIAQRLKDEIANCIKDILLDKPKTGKNHLIPQGFNWDQSISEAEQYELQQSGEAFKENEKTIFDLDDGVLSIYEFALKLQKYGDGRKLLIIENSLRELLSKNKLVGFRPNSNQGASWRIPAWQISSEANGGIIEGIDALCAIFGSNGLPVQNFIMNEELKNGYKPIDLIKNGKMNKVIQLAQKYTL